MSTTNEEPTMYTFTTKFRRYSIEIGRTYDSKPDNREKNRSRWATVHSVIDDDTRVVLETEHGRTITAKIENFVRGYFVDWEAIPRKRKHSSNRPRRKNLTELVEWTGLALDKVKGDALIVRVLEIERKLDRLIAMWS